MRRGGAGAARRGQGPCLIVAAVWLRGGEESNGEDRALGGAGGGRSGRRYPLPLTARTKPGYEHDLCDEYETVLRYFSFLLELLPVD